MKYPPFYVLKKQSEVKSKKVPKCTVLADFFEFLKEYSKHFHPSSSEFNCPWKLLVEKHIFRLKHICVLILPSQYKQLFIFIPYGFIEQKKNVHETLQLARKQQLFFPKTCRWIFFNYIMTYLRCDSYLVDSYSSLYIYFIYQGIKTTPTLPECARIWVPKTIEIDRFSTEGVREKVGDISLNSLVNIFLCRS